MPGKNVESSNLLNVLSFVEETNLLKGNYYVLETEERTNWQKKAFNKLRANVQDKKKVLHNPENEFLILNYPMNT